jgi:hypothetical protein
MNRLRRRPNSFAAAAARRAAAKLLSHRRRRYILTLSLALSLKGEGINEGWCASAPYTNAPSPYPLPEGEDTFRIAAGDSI